MTILSSDEERRLRLFQQRVQELRECGVVRQGKVHLRVDYPLGDAANLANDIPFEGFERDAFRSAMQTLRQFTLNKDEVHFYSICKLVRKRCERAELVDWSNYARDFWQQTMDSRPLGFRANGKEYDVKTAIDVMLYGFLAHTQKLHSKEWDALSPGAKATVYFIVQRSLLGLFFCLNLIDSVIIYWLDKPDVAVPLLGDVQCEQEEPSDDNSELE